MERPSFVALPKPSLVTFITEQTADETINTMREAIYGGTQGLAVHLCLLNREHHAEDELRKIFSYACDKPVMAINYRAQERNSDLSEDDRMEELVTAVKAGASIIDLPADTWDPEAKFQLSVRKDAVDKQLRLAGRIHELGGEVLSSCHTQAPMTAEQTVEHALKQQDRDVDMVKLVSYAYNEDQMYEAFRATTMLKKELRVPFIHVCSGQAAKMHRSLAPLFGSAICLCVVRYTRYCTKEQPLLASEKALFESVDRVPGRMETRPMQEYVKPF